MATRITIEQTKAPQFISAAKVQNFNWDKTKVAIRFENQNYFPVTYTEVTILRKRINLHHRALKNSSGELILWF